MKCQRVLLQVLLVPVAPSPLPHKLNTQLQFLFCIHTNQQIQNHTERDSLKDPNSSNPAPHNTTQRNATQHKHHHNKMKPVWSPDTASNAYVDTVQSCQLSRESGVAELVSAMAAGWNAQLIVETWSQGGVIPTSVGLAIASRHTGGRHVCIVPDERSRSEYAQSIGDAGMSPEIMVGEPEGVMDGLVGIDFLVVDSRRKDFSTVLRLAKLSSKGAVLLCKNAYSRTASSFKWRCILGQGSRRLVRTVFLPVGKGLDIAYVSATGGDSVPALKGVHGHGKKWIKHVDQQSGEVHVIRR